MWCQARCRRLVAFFSHSTHVSSTFYIDKCKSEKWKLINFVHLRNAMRRRNIFHGIRGVHKCQHSEWKYGSIRSVMRSEYEVGPYRSREVTMDSHSAHWHSLHFLNICDSMRSQADEAYMLAPSLFLYVLFLPLRHPSLAFAYNAHTHTHIFGTEDWKRAITRGWAGRLLCARVLLLLFFFFVSLFGQFKISQVFAQSGVLVSMLAVECWLVGGLRMHWINKRSVCNDAMLYARPGNHHTLTSQIYGLPRTSNFIIYNSITAIVGIVSAVRSLCMPISGFIYSCSSFYMFLFFLFHSFALIRCRTTKYFVGQRFHIWLGKVFKQKPDNTIADVIEWNWAKISCRSLALRRW